MAALAFLSASRDVGALAAAAAQAQSIGFAGPASHEVPLTPYAESAEQFLGERIAIWPVALLDLESVRPKWAVVTGIDFTPTDDMVRVEVVAQSHAAALSMLSELGAPESSARQHLRWALVRSSVGPEDSGTRALLVARAAVASRSARQGETGPRPGARSR